MSKVRIILGIIASVFLILIGCSEELVESNSDGKGKLKLHMIDAPADYDAVNIVVTRVEIHRDGAEDEGWFIVNDIPHTYDLLHLRNGTSVVLGEVDLPAGKYTQIRLIIGEGSNIVVNGTTHPLVIPSGQQTGLKLFHEFNIEPGILYEYTLDFDAGKSIHVTGNGKYMLRPTIRVIANAISGRISGRVLPLEANTIIWTTIGDDTISTITDGTGYFKLMALPQFNYDVHFTPQNSAYAEATVSNVEVFPNDDTNIGTIELENN